MVDNTNPDPESRKRYCAHHIARFYTILQNRVFITHYSLTLLENWQAAKFRFVRKISSTNL